ncbi:hypothetical protein X551_03718 [Methylibium sp. T29]|nr:hypothetical protein X551_03718 [Methylibium sp. T29]EWS58127.1 hypothetical protein Y694_03965 [Methylibium sp. T29-B]
MLLGVMLCLTHKIQDRLTLARRCRYRVGASIPSHTAFAQASLLQLLHHLATRRHGRYFPLSTSRIASISSIELASSFFSFVFSSSSAFSRCASETFMPPNLAFQA